MRDEPNNGFFEWLGNFYVFIVAPFYFLIHLIAAVVR